MNATQIENLLSLPFNTLVSELVDMSERDLEKLLNKEINCENRGSYLVRIHARLSKLRTKREREEMLR